jgi:hypothetical protein
MPAQKSSSLWWVLIPVGIAGGGVLLLLVMCAGIGLAFVRWSSSDSVAVRTSGPTDAAMSTPSYTPAYSPPAYTPAVYPEPATYTPAEPAYMPPALAYTPPAYVEPPQVSLPPAVPPAGSEQPFNFFSFDRAAELEAAIAADRQKLLELDIAIAAAAGGQGAGRIVERDSESSLDAFIGALFGAAAEGAKSQLQTERDAVQTRLNANLAELATLPR